MSVLPSVLPPRPLSLLRPAHAGSLTHALILAGNSGRKLTPRSGSGVEVGEERVQLVGTEQGFTPELCRFCRQTWCSGGFGWELTSDQLSTCRQRGGGGASRLLPVSAPRLGEAVGAVVPPALLGAPPPLQLPLAAERVGGAELLQEPLLHVLGSDPRLLLLPAGKTPG